MADDDLAAAVPLVRKAPWTMEEDRVLVNYVAAHGEGSWNYLARAAGLNRTGKSCCLRWLNYLSPDLRRGKMTAEEQHLVIHLHSLWGNQWSRIAKHLPGRTDNEVKNFWRTKIQKKQKREQYKDKDRSSAITATADLCSSMDNDDSTTPAETTEGQGSSSSGNSGGTTGLVTHDYGIVLAHQPSMCSVEEDQQLGDQVHGGAAGGGTSSAAAGGAMDFLPELLAASGENFWAIDDFWSTTLPCLGNNDI